MAYLSTIAGVLVALYILQDAYRSGIFKQGLIWATISFFMPFMGIFYFFSRRSMLANAGRSGQPVRRLLCSKCGEECAGSVCKRCGNNLTV